MYINEYGNPNDPKMILLAPMMVSGSDLYNLMSPYLKAAYFIIAPDQGGHGKAGAYISADEEYRQQKEYLQKNGYIDVKLLKEHGAYTGRCSRSAMTLGLITRWLRIFICALFFLLSGKLQTELKYDLS